MSMDNIEELRSRVFVEREAPRNTCSIDDVNAFESIGLDNSLTVRSFQESLQINVLERNNLEMKFEIIGIDPALANAFRRILIAEVPTMAIEKVNLYQNTSIMQDEVLAHRLGLVPIAVDPRKFDYVKNNRGKSSTNNTLVFTLDIECTMNPSATSTSPEKEQYINSEVYSRDLKWVPQGDQASWFEPGQEPRPFNPDILLLKLRPGQRIEAELLVEKGIGDDHAKFSPVATASYRLLPEIYFTKPIEKEMAKKLKTICPVNVFDIEQEQAKVARPRDCTMCRECIQPKDLEDVVRLRKVRNHFIFTIESVGIYSAEEVVLEAIDVLKAKCETVTRALNRLTQSS